MNTLAYKIIRKNSIPYSQIEVYVYPLQIEEVGKEYRFITSMVVKDIC